MSNYVIAYGGTGQHAALSFVKLSFLCQHILIASSDVPFFYVFDKDVGSGAGEGQSKTAGALLFDKGSRLGTSVEKVDPIPVVDTDGNVQKFGDLLGDSLLKTLLFNANQLNVQVVHGNFGQPAVGATGLYLKLYDSVSVSGNSVNKDSSFAQLLARIRNGNNDRIAHVGSATGGTGSGVMPAAVSWFQKENPGNQHLCIPVLEWFRLIGSGTNAQKATERNNLIRQNRSSGLDFYLSMLQGVSAVLPLGYDNTRLGSTACEREWEGDYNQTVKESAIHLAAALGIWQFFSGAHLPNGMYSYVTDEQYSISSDAPMGASTLGGVLSANLRLIREVDHLCNFLRNPPQTSHILFKYDERFIPHILKSHPKSQWRGIADHLQSRLANRREAVSWLQSLDFVDETIRNAKDEFQCRGIEEFSKLLPNNTSGKELVDALYAHLTERARTYLKGVNTSVNASPARLLPEYVRMGVKPPPAPKGSIALSDDPNYTKNLYRVSEICAESIPSPLGVARMIGIEITQRIARLGNPGSQTEEQQDLAFATQRRTLLFDRYLLLFKGLVAGEVVPERQFLWDDGDRSHQQKSLGWVVAHLGEEAGYSPELNLIHSLTFKTTRGQKVMGATAPSLFLFPSLLADDEDWRELEASINFPGRDVSVALAQWCEYVRQRDGRQDRDGSRPGWFRILWEEFKEFVGQPRTYGDEIIDAEFPVLWGDGLINLPLSKISVNSSAEVATNSSLIKAMLNRAFDVPTVHYKGGRTLYSQDTVTPIDHNYLKNPGMNATLLELASAFVDREGCGVVPDITLLNSDGSAITRTVIWCDIREKELAVTAYRGLACNCTTDGEISLSFGGINMVLDANLYHGVTPKSVKVERTEAFLDEKKNCKRFVDIPLKARYLSLLDERAEVAEPSDMGNGAGLQYKVKLRGREEAEVFAVHLTAQAESKGTILVWPRFRSEGWKAYFMYCDLERLDGRPQGLTLSPILRYDRTGSITWEMTAPLSTKEAKAITLNDGSGVGDAGNPLLNLGNWKDGVPRYLLVKGGGTGQLQELGLFSINLARANRAQDVCEMWGLDFGTQGSVVSYVPHQRQALPFQFNTDQSYALLEGGNYAQNEIRNSVRWFPTYPPDSTGDAEPYVLTQLAVDSEETVDRLNRNNSVIPVQHYNIVSLRADTSNLGNRLVTELKWPASVSSLTQGDSNRGGGRREYLALLLMMSLAERVATTGDSSAARTINLTASYPLRMAAFDLDLYKQDLKVCCDWLSQATGFLFGPVKSISESKAAASKVPGRKETVIADLGGGTLDLWMGTEKGDHSKTSIDSIRVGGLNFLREVAKSKACAGEELGFSLEKIYLQRKTDEVGAIISQSNPIFKKMYLAYFHLIVDYISRFVVGHVTRNYQPSSIIEIDFIIAGNGWKLFTCLHNPPSPLHETVVKAARERTENLIRLLENQRKQSYVIKLNAMEHNSKQTVANGAAESYNKGQNQVNNESIKTTAAISFEFPDRTKRMQDAEWTSTVPFPFAATFMQDHVSVRAEYHNGSYNFFPEIPDWKVDSAVFSSLKNDLHSACDPRLYDGNTSYEVLLRVSPFGVLCEKILISYRDKQDWDVL